MSDFHTSTALTVAECLLSLTALACILWRRQRSEYSVLCGLLAIRVGFAAFLTPWLLLGRHMVEKHLAYRIYFYAYWLSFVLESVASLMLILSLFNLAMAPLNGIKQLGRLVFRWAAGISVAVTLGLMLAPHADQAQFVANFAIEFQRMQGIMTLCLLLFVFFAARPLGISYTSRIFGVSLGLSVLAMTNLVTSAWIAHFNKMYTTLNVLDGIATCAALVIWTIYFILPEPKRRIVVLPTTSPFLRWNQISMALGDSPGFVAVGGVPPELFSPVELEVMRRASIKMPVSSALSLDRSQTA